MTYARNGDEITLTMTLTDYADLLVMLGMAIGGTLQSGDQSMQRALLRFINELNRTNAEYTPYQLPAAPPKEAIYAWIGEDEHGSGRVGLKQAMVPAGMIPLAAMAHHLDRLAKLKPQMEEQAAAFGKKIRLCRFECVGVAAETRAGE